MQRFRDIIVFLALTVLLAGCTGCGSHPEEGGEEGRVAQAADTLYTQEAAMNVYGMNPQRALLLSARPHRARTAVPRPQL